MSDKKLEQISKLKEQLIPKSLDLRFDMEGLIYRIGWDEPLLRTQLTNDEHDAYNILLLYKLLNKKK